MRDQSKNRRTPVAIADGEEILDLLQAVSRQLVGMTAAALIRALHERQASVSLPEYRILVLLRGDVVRSPSDVAAALQVSRGAIAQILGRLESARLVTRRVDWSDRRRSIVRLTSKGTRLVESVIVERERLLQPVLAELEQAEREAVRAGLEKLSRALEAASTS